MSKLSFQISAEMFSLLRQTEGEKKTFHLESARMGVVQPEIIPKSTLFYKKRKKLILF